MLIRLLNGHYGRHHGGKKKDESLPLFTTVEGGGNNGGGNHHGLIENGVGTTVVSSAQLLSQSVFA
ncbi:hypothetical protein ALC53_02135 [Atta colombica]|uniref:Uncharacterized protein n=1 Tax=Atta colombica TaxID=520822 RepID=A0A195BT25_9HYME|nr:hypothetical protein ALC53_02135 [Atta colombica]